MLRREEKWLKMSSRAYEAKMRHSSIKKEVLVEDSDNVRDIRLERRLKRRSVANQSLINDSCTKGRNRASQSPAREAIKRTSQTPAREVIVLDEEDYNIDKTPQAVSAKDDQFDKDYKVYLNRLEENRFNPSLEDDDLDPQYKMFWENVREDANSFVLKIAVDKDIHILLKYEEDDRFGGEGRPGSRHNLRTATKSENMENPKILNDFAARERKTLIDKKLRPDLSKKASSKDLSSSKPKREHEPEPCDTGIDESYKIFLEFLKEEDNCLTFVNRHGKRVKYEEESESESEMLAAEGDPCIGERKETPCVKSKPFDSSVCILFTLHFVVFYLKFWYDLLDYQLFMVLYFCN